MKFKLINENTRGLDVRPSQDSVNESQSGRLCILFRGTDNTSNNKYCWWTTSLRKAYEYCSTVYFRIVHLDKSKVIDLGSCESNLYSNYGSKYSSKFQSLINSLDIPKDVVNVSLASLDSSYEPQVADFIYTDSFRDWIKHKPEDWLCQLEHVDASHVVKTYSSIKQPLAVDSSLCIIKNGKLNINLIDMKNLLLTDGMITCKLNKESISFIREEFKNEI